MSFYLMKNYVNVASKSNKQNSRKKIAQSGAGSESVSQRYESADPDPYQNVMDPATLVWVH
jgi:hypothetical protein